jgi:hypothetical protein
MFLVALHWDLIPQGYEQVEYDLPLADNTLLFTGYYGCH